MSAATLEKRLQGSTYLLTTTSLLMLVFAFSLSVCAFAANIPSDDNEQYVLATGVYEV